MVALCEGTGVDRRDCGVGQVTIGERFGKTPQMRICSGSMTVHADFMGERCMVKVNGGRPAVDQGITTQPTGDS